MDTNGGSQRSNFAEKNGFETMGPPEPLGPNLPPPADRYGPEPLRVRPVVLVLGPGLAKTFAYAGVLRALNDAKIPVGAIVSTEMGALIGGLYATHSSINGFEWALMKFKDELLFKRKRFLSAVLNPDSKLDDLLLQVFGQKDLTETKVPFRVVVQKSGSAENMTLRQGPLYKSIRAAMSTPGNLKPIKLDGAFDGKSAVISSGESRPFPVLEAKQLDIGPVIVVNVTYSSVSSSKTEVNSELIDYVHRMSKSGWESLKEADLVLTPDLRGIDFFDFDKRNEIFFRGKKAVIDNESTIRQLVGMPP